MTHRDVRVAAESLLTQQSQSQIHDSITSLLLDSEVASLSSLNSLHFPNSESIMTGARINGRMSAVRRCFCLFVLFDVLLSVFTWLIISMLTVNGDLINCFKKEILHYKFESSLFDIVMAAFCRFTVLLLFYGLLHLKTRLYIALTTAGTCVFLIMKVLYYKWSEANQPAIQGPFLLISFVLAWSEVWFLDFRVVPMEEFATEEQINRVRVRERMRNRANVPVESEGASQFHSPLDSDREPDHGDGEKSFWTHLAEKTVNDIYSLIIEDENCWRLQKQEPYASVFTRTLPQHGVVYCLKFSVDLPILDVKKELFDNVSQMTCWNAAITVSERVQLLSDTCDVIYQVSPKNVIAAERDMILVRKCAVINKSTVISCASIKHPAKPEERKYTRVKCGPSGWILQPNENNPDVTKANFLMSTDLQLWLPQSALIVPVANSLLTVAAGLQKRAQILLNNA